jgi:hypothetical protein
MTATGSSPEVLSKVVHLQKALAESGMAKHEIASALTLAMAMANADTKETLNQLLDHFADVLDKGSILQNSVSGENFSGIFSFNLWINFQPKETYVYKCI